MNDAYLKRLEEASSDSEREENIEITTKGIEELVIIPRHIQSVIKFIKDMLKVNKLTTNVCKPKYKRQVNVSTMEYDISPLVIESNAYIIYQGTKNLTKLVQEKDFEVIKLKKEKKNEKDIQRILGIRYR